MSNSRTHPQRSRPVTGQNPLERDLVDLRRIAQDDRNNSASRLKAEEAAAKVDWFLTKGNDWFHKEAKRLGVSKWCAELSDEQIAYLVSDSVREPEPIVYRAAHTALKECFLSEGCLPGWRFHYLVRWLFNVMTVALATEVGRRQQQAENPAGRALREVLVEEDARADLLSELSQETTGWLWMPGDIKEGRRDAVSEVIARIWEDIDGFAAVVPVAANPAALKAFMGGEFNGVPQRARDHLRTLIETAHRRAKKNRSHSADEEADTQVQLVEQLADPKNFSDEWDRKLLVEQLLSRGDLSELENKVVRSHYFEGETQEEIAASLPVSQSKVSKVLDKAQEKLQTLLFQHRRDFSARP
jgi:RNA polymerase sigma factor (sigma-70 family)